MRYFRVASGRSIVGGHRWLHEGHQVSPWNAIRRYRRVEQGPTIEMACAENNEVHFHHGLAPMPQADRPDF